MIYYGDFKDKTLRECMLIEAILPVPLTSRLVKLNIQQGWMDTEV